jgi:hypothetical protein
VTVELYGFGSEPPPDEPAQTETVLAWQHAQEVFAQSRVQLSYVNINSDLERCFWLRIWDFPTFRILLDGHEIGRSNCLFLSAEKLEQWVGQIVARA